MKAYVRFTSVDFKVFSFPLPQRQKDYLEYKLPEHYHCPSERKSRKKAMPSMETSEKINWRIDPNRDDDLQKDPSIDISNTSRESDAEIKCSQRKLSKQSSLFLPSRNEMYFEIVVSYLQFQHLELKPTKEILQENTLSAEVFVLGRTEKKSDRMTVATILKKVVCAAKEVTGEDPYFRIIYSTDNRKRLGMRNGPLAIKTLPSK